MTDIELYSKPTGTTHGPHDDTGFACAGLGWKDDGIVAVTPPRPHPWARIRYTARIAADSVTQLGRRAVSAVRSPRELELTAYLYAELGTDDRDTAQAALERFLHEPDTKVVVHDLYHGGQLFTACLDTVGSMTVQLDDDKIAASVRAVITATAIVPACVAELAVRHGYAEVEPYLTPEPIEDVWVDSEHLRHVRAPRRRTA